MNSDAPDDGTIAASQFSTDALNHCKRSTTTRIASKSNLNLELIEGLRAGSNDSYVKFVESHIGTMLKIARRYLGEEDAKDAVQEAFTSAFDSIDQFKGSSHIGTWLQRILINCCLMQLRRSKAEIEVPIDALLPKFSEDGHRADISPAWPDECLERLETVTMISTNIHLLPDKYRIVLMLRDIDGYSGEETAQLLGIRVNLVKVRLHRARQALREMIDSEIGSWQ